MGEHLRRTVLKLVRKLLRVYSSREATGDIVLLLLLLLVLLLIASTLLVLSTSAASVIAALVRVLISRTIYSIICIVSIALSASSAFRLLILMLI